MEGCRGLRRRLVLLEARRGASLLVRDPSPPKNQRVVRFPRGSSGCQNGALIGAENIKNVTTTPIASWRLPPCVSQAERHLISNTWVAQRAPESSRAGTRPHRLRFELSERARAATGWRPDPHPSPPRVFPDILSSASLGIVMANEQGHCSLKGEALAPMLRPRRTCGINLKVRT